MAQEVKVLATQPYNPLTTYNWIQVKAQYTGVDRNPSALHQAEGRIALNLVSQQQQQKLTPQQG